MGLCRWKSVFMRGKLQDRIWKSRYRVSIQSRWKLHDSIREGKNWMSLQVHGKLHESIWKHCYQMSVQLRKKLHDSIGRVLLLNVSPIWHHLRMLQSNVCAIAGEATWQHPSVAIQYLLKCMERYLTAFESVTVKCSSKCVGSYMRAFESVSVKRLSFRVGSHMTAFYSVVIQHLFKCVGSYMTAWQRLRVMLHHMGVQLVPFSDLAPTGICS